MGGGLGFFQGLCGAEREPFRGWGWSAQGSRVAVFVPCKGPVVGELGAGAQGQGRPGWGLARALWATRGPWMLFSEQREPPGRFGRGSLRPTRVEMGPGAGGRDQGGACERVCVCVCGCVCVCAESVSRICTGRWLPPRRTAGQGRGRGSGEGLCPQGREAAGVSAARGAGRRAAPRWAWGTGAPVTSPRGVRARRSPGTWTRILDAAVACVEVTGGPFFPPELPC